MKYQITINDSDFKNIINGKIRVIIATKEYVNAKEEDIFELYYENKMIKTKITSVKFFKNYEELPYSHWGLDYGTFNPYFYDNYSINELKALEFMVLSTNVLDITHTVALWKNEIELIKEKKSLFVIRVNDEEINFIKQNHEILFIDPMTSVNIKTKVISVDYFKTKQEVLKNIENEDLITIPKKEFILSSLNDNRVNDYGLKIIKIQVI